MKTPVASIQGLIHAVRDQIVAGAEADEFLDISLKETERLQQMISDLLDFNSFASGNLNMDREKIEFGKLLNEVTYQWSLIHQDESFELNIHLPD